MIREDYVSLETAVLLKEKGFDETCSYEWGIPDVDKGYVLQKWVINNGQIRNSDLIDEAYAAPTQSHAQKWLRLVHNLHIYAFHTELYNGTEWCYEIENLKEGWTYSKHYGMKHEESIEEAIKYALKNFVKKYEN